MVDESGMVGNRPLPALEKHTRPFWDALREHRLVLVRCDACRSVSHPPDVSCPACGSGSLSWVEASGRATLWSWTVCYPPMLPWFAQHGSWPVAVVELEEGVRMVTTLRGVASDQLELGLPLRAGFDDLDDGVTMLVFEPR